MSIKGQSFSNSPDGAHIATAVGNAGGLYTGSFTVMCLAKSTSSNRGFFAGWSGGVGGTSRGGMLLAIAKLFGESDFSSGFGPGSYDDGAWRWYGYSKLIDSDPGNSHYVMHVADLATLTWSHGESSGAGDHSDTGVSDAFSLGMNSNYALGFNSGDQAAEAVWTSFLSSAAIEAACTQAAANLVAGNPTAGWLFPEATSGSPIVDFTGGGADETSRAFIATSPDPADYDFTLSSPAVSQRFLPFF